MSQTQFMPKLIVSDFTEAHLRSLLSPSVAINVTKLRIERGYRFYVTRQDRGRCYWNDRVITIPIWALKKNARTDGVGHADWYVSHEMAHAFTHIVHGNGKEPHGAEFMAILKTICPVEAQHWELGYKPMNAVKAGLALNFDF